METLNFILYISSSLISYLILRLVECYITIHRVNTIMREELEKRQIAERLRWTERAGRTKAEQNLRAVIETQRQEVDGNTYSFKPMAYAHSCYVHCQGVPRQPGLAPNARSRIDIEEWVPPPAFDDLAQYSHIWVMFVFHLNTNISTLQKSNISKGFTFPAKVRPPRLLGKSTGLFATRTPHRPCPIGLSVVKLEEVHAWGKERYLIVSNTDIVDGSPILDIKPYLPNFDKIENAIVPEWVMQIQSAKPVNFSNKSLEQLNNLEKQFKFYKNMEEMKSVLIEVLGADVSKRSDRRLSEFEFDCLSVLFVVRDGEIFVDSILLTSEYEKYKSAGLNLLF